MCCMLSRRVCDVFSANVLSFFTSANDKDCGELSLYAVKLHLFLGVCCHGQQ